MDNYVNELKLLKLDIDKSYHNNMNYIIYEYSCDCSEFCNCINRLCHILHDKYTWLKQNIEGEIIKLEYMVNGINLIS